MRIIDHRQYVGLTHCFIDHGLDHRAPKATTEAPQHGLSSSLRHSLVLTTPQDPWSKYDPGILRGTSLGHIHVSNSKYVQISSNQNKSDYKWTRGCCCNFVSHSLPRFLHMAPLGSSSKQPMRTIRSLWPFSKAASDVDDSHVHGISIAPILIYRTQLQGEREREIEKREREREREREKERERERDIERENARETEAEIEPKTKYDKDQKNPIEKPSF